MCCRLSGVLCRAARVSASRQARWISATVTRAATAGSRTVSLTQACDSRNLSASKVSSWFPKLNQQECINCVVCGFHVGEDGLQGSFRASKLTLPSTLWSIDISPSFGSTMVILSWENMCYLFLVDELSISVYIIQCFKRCWLPQVGFL